MKKYYHPFAWTRNRLLYFQLGVIISLLFCLKVINLESNVSHLSNIEIEPLIDHTEPLISINFDNKIKPIPRIFLTSEAIEEIIPINTPEIKKVALEIQESVTNENSSSYTSSIDRAPLPLPEYEDEIEEIIPNKIYERVERMPLFKECLSEFTTYQEQLACTNKKIQETIQQRLRYPVIPRENNMEATVIASFIIDQSGSITEIKIEREEGHGFDEAVLDVMQYIPGFLPGEQNQQKVRVKMYLPIKFRLRD